MGREHCLYFENKVPKTQVKPIFVLLHQHAHMRTYTQNSEEKIILNQKSGLMESRFEEDFKPSVIFATIQNLSTHT